MKTIQERTHSLAAAIYRAMLDIRKNGHLAPVNPAILHSGNGEFHYGSALNDEPIAWDLQEGLGAWEPDENTDLDKASDDTAAALIKEIVLNEDDED